MDRWPIDPRRLAWLLLAAGVWTAYVWITRIVILARQDESLAFKAVHYGLASISLAFAAALLWAGWRLLRG